MTTIKYDMEFDGGQREVIDITFDTDSLALDMPDPDPLPDWTELRLQQCENCPLRAEDHSHCPLAKWLVPIAERFGATPSYEGVILHVTTEARVVSASTTAQAALGSLMGLIMPLSGCPKLAPLAPMARFHLPLSTHEETIYRAVSMFLLSQYFADETGPQAVSDLSGLQRIYADIQRVNQGIAARLRSSGAFNELNSIAVLDLYAQTMPLVINESLSDIRHLFADRRAVA